MSSALVHLGIVVGTVNKNKPNLPAGLADRKNYSTGKTRGEGPAMTADPIGGTNVRDVDSVKQLRKCASPSMLQRGYSDCVQKSTLKSREIERQSAFGPQCLSPSKSCLYWTAGDRGRHLASHPGAVRRVKKATTPCSTTFEPRGLGRLPGWGTRDIRGNPDTASSRRDGLRANYSGIGQGGPQ